MNYTPPEKPVPESIAASLARSEAQIEKWEDCGAGAGVGATEAQHRAHEG